MSKDLSEKKNNKNDRGQTVRPRLVVFRSNKEIYGQIVDNTGKILASASSLKIKEKNNKTKIAKQVGKNLAERAQKAGIKKIIFDRRKYKYHGRIAALAAGARAGGLKF